MRLKGKVAIITGAAQGMGASHARLFIEEGAKVVLTDLNVAKGEQLAKNLGDNALFVKHDVTVSSDWDNVIQQTQQKFGRIDVLVNNAGIVYIKSLFDVTEDDYKKIFNINQLSVFLGTQKVGRVMKEQSSGSIINISSISGLVGGAIGYTDTKFAVRGLTKAAALELANYGVRVNSVHPGVIDTPMIHQGDSEAQIDAFAQSIPFKRVARPDEVSKCVLYLASDDSSYSTGAEFIVDGGLSAE